MQAWRSPRSGPAALRPSPFAAARRIARARGAAADLFVLPLHRVEVGSAVRRLVELRIEGRKVRLAAVGGNQSLFLLEGERASVGVQQLLFLLRQIRRRS